MSKEIQIQGEIFEISTPYAEGHTLSAAEANALNQVRCENIANNMRARVKAAKEGGDGAPSLDDVRAAVTAYDKEYEISLAASRGSRSTTTPLEKESRKVARAWLTSKLKEAGKTFKAYVEENDKEYVEAKILEVAENEAIQAQAKKNLKEREKAAAAPLDISI